MSSSTAETREALDDFLADEERVPELGLLEFLGEFEDADGVWIDPLAFDPETETDASRPVTAAERHREETKR